ncbi:MULTISPECIES: cupin domain-containing protein [unclassified Amycolatopsis]|uniref:cupin domain-containing protein n=1 Tax=unclassified Amycolatopsis TaxID=2618356 RepID=UPI002E16345F|nr:MULTISPECIES: cupin domain-containing protein [unclassified Amycolatopsis]WSJ78300.1 cupin domain-containing protein [Amycolatopsis sp. NBC_01307]WSK78132.1 cupin domain-containing protein [Amycolatopsis sp. NBC_01286]
MSTSGPEFAMSDFLTSIAHVVRPGEQRPLVVHDEDLVEIPAGSVPNPTSLRVAGTLPTTTFELFRQVIPAGESSDMQRHHHETVHFVIAGDGHSEIEDEVVSWTTGSFVYTPPWTWHRHHNDSAEHPVEFLTIENSRLLGLFGLGRRESAGLATMEEARKAEEQ